MKILDFLCPDAVIADLKATNKKELIEEMVSFMVEAGAF
ncbi:MAG: PTS sugar transporter subunit IIA, partial [Candidatus Omnitrophica bacterium]|nr:PTS sugar transporter subunit IIA [Candidatus Omnitrophota bacterium]